MAVISFKSVGKTRQQRIETVLSSSVVPIGIATPLQLGEDGNIFKMHGNIGDQINDNLRNLLLTNRGERLTLYDYGASLRSILSEMSSSDDFDTAAVISIKSAVDRYMPFVSLETFESNVDHVMNSSSNGLSVIKLTITYNVPTLKIFKKGLEVLLYAM